MPPAAIRSTSFDSVDCLLVVVGFSLSSGSAGRIALEAPLSNRILEDAHWNADRQTVEFGVEIGEYRGVVRVPRRVFQRLLPERPTPQRCVEAYYLQRTRFEGIAERKLRRRQLTEDGNVEISGRDLQ